MMSQSRLVILGTLTLVFFLLTGLVVGADGAKIGTSVFATAWPFSVFAGPARGAIEHALIPIAAKVLPWVPSPVVELAPVFAHGAASLVMVGSGARKPPAAVGGAKGDEVLQHTTAKSVYAAGAIVAEIALLKLVYREPYRNQRNNRANFFFATATGFLLLVILTALPNPLVDTSLVCVFYFKLSSQVYVPAVICGQLLRAYLLALVPKLPPLSAAYIAFSAYWTDSFAEGLSTKQAREACAELVLAAIVAGACLFSRSALHRTGSSPPATESENDDDDYCRQ